MQPNKLYLLSGNGSTKAWWEDALPHFQHLRPIPLELPGFGDHPDPPCSSLEDYAEALLAQTEPGHDLFAVGINGLVALHALSRRPGHFRNLYLMAPVGAFLWERRFVKVMKWPPIRNTILYLLRNYPRLFARKFSSRKWTRAQYQRMGDGYRKCRAFSGLFSMVNGVESLDLLEYVRGRVVLIWGKNDAVLGLRQAAAWDTLLCRADLEVVVREDWEHYPYIDDPEGFARVMEAGPSGFRAHGKAGRLTLGRLAGLPVPQSWTATAPIDLPDVVAQLSSQKLYAVRSSGANEDQVDNSNAGRNHSYLRVPPSEVESRARELLEGGLAEVAIQEFVEPVISGVAFARKVSTEVEMVAGHLEGLVSGTANPVRFVASGLGADWRVEDSQAPVPGDGPAFRKNLVAFLQRCIATFHYVHADLEWGWDGNQFHLFQIRPVTRYPWRRSLTSANLDEILPARVSRLMEHAQRRASLSIGRLYGLWDGRSLADAEPFSVVHQDASYINLDLFMARFRDWGLPSQLLGKEIGAAVPKVGFSLVRFVRSIPTFLRMQRVARRRLLQTRQDWSWHEQQLSALLKEGQVDEERLVDWFVRFYVFIVRQNMLVNACLSASGGSFLGKGKTVYGTMESGSHPHRLQFESDPATPRPEVEADLLKPMAFPPDQWPGWLRWWHRMGLPGAGGYYFEVREWFRDSNMRLFHRLHLALKGSPWLELHPGERHRSGTFWQDGGGVLQQDFGFLIVPGTAEGVVGKDILVVEALEPGHLSQYEQAKAVVSRTGGRLSHGATLLREIEKPSAIVPDAPREWEGRHVRYDNGKLTLLDS